MTGPIKTRRLGKWNSRRFWLEKCPCGELLAITNKPVTEKEILDAGHTIMGDHIKGECFDCWKERESD